MTTGSGDSVDIALQQLEQLKFFEIVEDFVNGLLNKEDFLNVLLKDNVYLEFNLQFSNASLNINPIVDLPEAVEPEISEPGTVKAETQDLGDLGLTQKTFALPRAAGPSHRVTVSKVCPVRGGGPRCR